MTLRALALTLFLAVAFTTGAAWAKPVQTDHVEAELIAERTAIEPGKPVHVGLRLKMDNEWHTYWRNPGDTGLPTTIAWKLPKGFAAGDIEWPAPHRIDIATLANYGYDSEIVLPVTLSTTAALKPGQSVPVKAHAEWLVCREQCIPGAADLELELRVMEKSDADPKWSALFAKAKQDQPRAADDWKWAAHKAQGADGRIDIVWSASSDTTPTKVQFFPIAEGVIEPAAAQKLYRLADGRLRLNLQLAKQAAVPASIDGVLTAASGLKVAGEDVRAVSMRANVGPSNILASGGTPIGSGVTYAAGAQGGAASLGFALILAVIGGLILNLMPCVFPVISLKVLGFAQQAHGRARVIRIHGLVFAGGVIASFVALAVIVLTLRESGQNIGWGFQLQSPVVITSLAILFFLLTLNVAGFFEVGTLIPGRVASMQPKNPYLNSFLSGVLAVVIASPCTAPFMGAALGYALSQPADEALAVFVALGFGMALPYLILAWFPAWLKKLPKPGAWMVWLKQLLAIPLAATVIWLGWVLEQQSGADAFARLAFVLLLLGTVIWLMRGRQLRRSVQVAFAAIALVGAVVLAVPLFDDPPPEAVKSATAASDVWQPWSPQGVEMHLDAGHPVFVDFTAAWCVSCQANKKLVLERSDTIKMFNDRKVVLMRADWTRRDPEITAALAGFGRSGVPVYALYRPGKDTLVLPEILTDSILRDATKNL